MGLWRRLDSIDRLFVNRADRRFDVPRPWWVRYSVVVALPLVLSVSFDRGYSGAWWVALLFSTVLFLVVLVLVSRWERDHRRPKEEFDRAVDRQL
jgi:ABC-type transport system involved in Fe-S cluster assembly fused permease/ATPase subunit